MPVLLRAIDGHEAIRDAAMSFVVLGDGEGGTSTLVLTIQLDALLEEDSS